MPGALGATFGGVLGVSSSRASILSSSLLFGDVSVTASVGGVDAPVLDCSVGGVDCVSLLVGESVLGGVVGDVSVVGTGAVC